MVMTETTWLLVGLVGVVGLLMLAYRLVTARLRNARWRRDCFEAWVQQDTDEARPHLEAALKTAEDFGSNDSRLALTLIDLANLYRSEGREAEANTLEKRALNIFEDMFPYVMIFARPAINAMANLYRDQLQYGSNPNIHACRPNVIESMESAVKRAAQIVASTDGELSLYYYHINIYYRALAIREKVLGPEHLLVASSLETLAASLRILVFNEPVKCLKRALEIREKVQGPDHPDVANTIETQANRYFVEQVPAYKRVLAIREKAWGPEHPDLIPTLKCLASKHQGLGQNDSAEPLYERALALREKEFGSDHLEIVEDLYALADNYRAQNKTNESEVLLKRALSIRENHYERALAIREKEFGSDHLEIVEELNALADVYRGQSKANEAEVLLKRTLSIRENHLGSKHPEVAGSLDILAWLYDTAEDFGKAEPLLKRALKIREKNLPESYETAQSLEELAGLYIAQGHFSDAKPLLERALEIRENIGDIEPPAVADRHLKRFWFLYWHHHDHLPLLKRALAIREVAFGQDRMRVDGTLEVYVDLLRDAGRESEAKEIIAKYYGGDPTDHPHAVPCLELPPWLDEAEPLTRIALAIFEKALGPEHPELATTINNLTELYRAQGHYTEAEPLIKRALAIFEKALGPEHPELATTINNLAELYQDRGKFTKAEPLYQRSLAIREKVLGPEHPDVAQSLNNLAELYYDQGKYAEAEPLYQRSMVTWEKALGPEHPDLAQSLENYSALLRKTGRGELATMLELRSKAIRAKHADANPVQ